MPGGLSNPHVKFEHYKDRYETYAWREKTASS